MQSGGQGSSPAGLEGLSSGNVANQGTDNLQAPEEADDIVQVVYQSNNNGSMVGVESSLISGPAPSASYDSSGQLKSTNSNYGTEFDCQAAEQAIDESAAYQVADSHQPISRTGSTLPPVAEETIGGGTVLSQNIDYDGELLGVADRECLEERTPGSSPQVNNDFAGLGCQSGHSQPEVAVSDSCCLPHCSDLLGLEEIGNDLGRNPDAIYSTISRQPKTGPRYSENPSTKVNPDQTILYGDPAYNPGALEVQPTYDGGDENREPSSHLETNEDARYPSIDQRENYTENEGKTDEERKDIEEINAEICRIISRQKQGAAESGSLKQNRFKKKLVVSTSSNENDLTAHRQKFLESQDATNQDEGALGSLPSKFKRTHSVSFNVSSSRDSRHSVDIRNLPSYLTVKRASIVDVAKGAMSSLMHSFGGGTASSSISNSRRDSGNAIDEEPIFEDPIAPTLSLGQRVALVKNDGAEFGTVGWIGQLPDVDDDWVVGVIFDNMIGNCDGAYNGVRYFYSRENFAMFVPLSALTKTDNYIGRPETGTMLSRMSVSLKPGQLISIQRSSIRLQHCFLNAPHQRVGHDVRAVSNRLHCQCHNCGPCAHLTKQHSRVNALPAFGAHHAVNKKNSLAHAAVEILAHHHHHYHEEEHHEEEDYQFGDNAAHACNFVRYSCCQQNGGAGHEFSSDCGLVRPELLDNLIHAPRAPHRRSARPRRVRRTHQQPTVCGMPQQQPAIDTGSSTLDSSSKKMQQIGGAVNDQNDDDSRSCSSCSSSSSSRPSLRDRQDAIYSQNTNSYQIDSMNFFLGSTMDNTVDSRMSLHDQQRFIYQRESTITTRGRLFDNDHHDEGANAGGLGLIPRLRRCFGCLKRRGTGRRRRPKKRKLSARNRLIEYRRKQSTFVPSTLAKPQDDFASHGIVLPGWDPDRHGAYNSDYSSYSKSTGSESPDNSPNRTPLDHSNTTAQQQFISIDHDVRASDGQLKSPSALDQRRLNYDDYTFDNDGYRSYEKFAHSQDSDLGYFDLMTNSSGGTLKEIVDQAIDREESLQQLAPIEAAISPVESGSVSNCCDQVDVSSPTLSMGEDTNELSERLEGFQIGKSTDSSA